MMIKRFVAGLVVMATAGAGLAGCSAPSDAEWSYPSARAARTSEQSGRVPGLLPSDASDVRLHVALRGYGAQLEWRSVDGITASYCTPGAISGQASSVASWWPSRRVDRGWDCGTWDVFEQDGAYYAWDVRQQ